MSESFLVLETKYFKILRQCAIKNFSYSQIYKLWHIHFQNGDDMFIYDENIIKLEIYDEDYNSIALAVNGHFKYIKDNLDNKEGL